MLFTARCNGKAISFLAQKQSDERWLPKKPNHVLADIDTLVSAFKGYCRSVCCRFPRLLFLCHCFLLPHTAAFADVGLSLETIMNIAHALDVSADQLLVDSLPQNKNDLNSLLLDCTPEEVSILIENFTGLKKVLSKYQIKG